MSDFGRGVLDDPSLLPELVAVNDLRNESLEPIPAEMVCPCGGDMMLVAVMHPHGDALYRCLRVRHPLVHEVVWRRHVFVSA